MAKLTCWTKEDKEGDKYTTCLQGQKGYKKKPAPKKKKLVIKEKPKPVEIPKKKKLVIKPKPVEVPKRKKLIIKEKPKPAPKKKKLVIKEKPKPPTITITENPRDNVIPVSRALSYLPDSYTPTTKRINVGKDAPKPVKVEQPAPKKRKMVIKPKPKLSESEEAKSKLSANQLKINTERNEVLNKLIAEKDTEGIKYIKKRISVPYVKDQIDSGEKTYTDLYDTWIREKKFNIQSAKMDTYDATINSIKEKKVDIEYKKALDKFDREGGSGAGAGAGAGESAVSLIEKWEGGRVGLEKYILKVKRNIKGSARLPKLKDTSKSNILTGDGSTYGTPVGLYKLIFTSLKNVKQQEIFEKNIKQGLMK